jgi:hypothetical protein
MIAPPSFDRAARGVLLFAFAAGLASACATEERSTPLDGPLGEIAQAVVTVGDWNGYGDGQCVIGAQIFYKGRFGVTLKATGYQPGDIGACANLGACMYWVSDIVRPDPALWNRYDFGSTMPQTYDLVIYPPTAGNAYGHIASVDHMEGGDANNHGQLYVMDSNAIAYEKKSPYIHTNKTRPYGFYRLKSLEIPVCNEGCEGNVVSHTSCQKVDCGAQKAVCVQDGGLRCDALPQGALDTADGTSIRGWSFDPSTASTAIDVHLYLGGPAGDPNAIGIPLHASDPRDDLCGAIGSCAHAFTFRTPRSLLDGKPHVVHAYGIDATGGHNAELGNSPRTLQAAAPAVPAGALLRRVPSATAFSTWKFSLRDDVAPLPDDASKFAEWKNQAKNAPPLPSAPEAVRSDDGSSQVWLLDSGVRRRIDAAAWHLVATDIEALSAPQLLQIPEGADFPAEPELVADMGPTYYVLDVPFLAERSEPKAPAPTGAGNAGSAGTGGPPSAGTVTPRSPSATGGASARTTTVAAESGDADQNACSVRSVGAANGNLAAVAVAACTLLSARRRRARRAS